MARLTLLPLLGLASVLSACGGDMSDLEQFIETTKNKHHGSVEQLPDFPPYETFEYKYANVRDPFRPQTDANVPISQTSSDGPRPESQRLKEPLESYPVDALKMVGLLQQREQTWGLVQDPDGTIHRVQPGNYAGKNHGKIIAVKETRIDIVELVPDGLSGWVNRDAILAMAEEN